MSEENTEEVKLLEEQIQHLQTEIKGLQQQQQDHRRDRTFHFRGRMQEVLAYLCGQRGGAGKETLVSRVKEEVEELEEDLKLQTQMNGINLSSCITRTLQSSGRETVQQFCLSGRCSELVFQLEFKLSEVKGPGAERRIRDLNVVLDSSDLQSFSSFLSRVEENNGLLLFFRTLRTFSDRCDDRTRTFQHFQEKFPSIVSLPGGCRSEVMSLNHPELPGCVFFLRWSVDVSAEGVVAPNIQLLPKIPEQALKLFPLQPAGGTAEAFQSLLRLLGPEAAIESVIRAAGLLPELSE